jgi:hypothetical protein
MIVAVEDQTHYLARLHEVEGLLEKLARRAVCRDNNQKAVDPFPEDAAIGDRYDRWSIDDDVIVTTATVREELPHPRRL